MKPDKFKVWYVHQVPGKRWEQEVPDAATGLAIIEAVYRVALFLFDNKMIPDYANTGGVVYWDAEEGEWFDYEPEDWEDEA